MFACSSLASSFFLYFVLPKSCAVGFLMPKFEPGEGSTKFPPALRPYALPKFDFDKSLQGNLRFDDSLVETEVYLGIGSNEDD